jgi:hypothetical protein
MRRLGVVLAASLVVTACSSPTERYTDEVDRLCSALWRAVPPAMPEATIDEAHEALSQAELAVSRFVSLIPPTELADWHAAFIADLRPTREHIEATAMRCDVYLRALHSDAAPA